MGFRLIYQQQSYPAPPPPNSHKNRLFLNESVIFLIAEDVDGDEITKDPETTNTSLGK